ncbi:MAG: hypothetical protein R2697_00105 [Ilumatobacteraceae bacterium]
MRTDDGDRTIRLDRDQDRDVVPAPSLDRGRDGVRPRRLVDGATVATEHRRREHLLGRPDDDRARPTVVEVPAPTRRADADQVAFEAFEFIGRVVHRREHRRHAGAVIDDFDRRCDDLEPTVADLDHRTETEPRRAVDRRAVDAQWVVRPPSAGW